MFSKSCLVTFFVSVFLSVLFTFPLSESAHAENGTMMQYFHWYLDDDGSLWNKVTCNAEEIANAGFTALWLPPAYKGDSGSSDIGYGVYDMYDLGKYDQQGSIRTKYGTEEEYLFAIDQAHINNIDIYGDVVFNHRAGADHTEDVLAVKVQSWDRNQEVGDNVWIKAYTHFTFDGRGDERSAFDWRWYHFDGTDYDANNPGDTSSIYKFRGDGKAWDVPVDSENGNYDYLMFADIDFEHPEVINELNTWGDWYVDYTGVDGFRLDAIKHIKYDFFNGWLDYMRRDGDELFTVGEFWSYEISKLHDYITQTGGRMSLFDAPLHNNFYNASNSGGSYDMARIMDNTLMKDQPALAVTLVDNHDTQPCQALESPVQGWFKPLAYAFILLREEGYPNVFYADYYGTDLYQCSDTRSEQMASYRGEIDTMLSIRKRFAYGVQNSYLDHHDVIGWTREGTIEYPGGVAVVMTDGPGGDKNMSLGAVNSNKTYYDITGNRTELVSTDSFGYASFPVNGGSYSIWIPAPRAFNNPMHVDQYNNPQRIWSSQINGTQFCRELGYPVMESHVEVGGEVEMNYVEYVEYPLGSMSYQWRDRESGSSNDGYYPIFERITCSSGVSLLKPYPGGYTSDRPDAYDASINTDYYSSIDWDQITLSEPTSTDVLDQYDIYQGGYK